MGLSIQMLVNEIHFDNFIRMNLDINGIVGYQILLQYLLRNLGNQSDNSFLDDVDGVNENFIK
jgi:hypothetical protein